MPDDLRIPEPAHAGFATRPPLSGSYRARHAQPAGWEALRPWALGAAALAGVAAVGVGGWAVLMRKPAAIPVIEADTRPIRIKPDNPGGMQVVGADEQVLGGSGSDSAAMAPAAEAPAPQALRAQMAHTAQTAQTATTAANAPHASAPAPAAVPPKAVLGQSPLPDTPLRQARTSTPTPALAAAAATSPGATSPGATSPPAAGQALSKPGAVQVQLAALESEAAAQAEWARLAKRMPELLGERKPVFQKAERDGNPVWRVRTGGFGDMAEATGFCTKLKARGGACTLASF